MLVKDKQKTALIKQDIKDQLYQRYLKHSCIYLAVFSTVVIIFGAGVPYLWVIIYFTFFVAENPLPVI